MSKKGKEIREYLERKFPNYPLKTSPEGMFKFNAPEIAGDQILFLDEIVTRFQGSIQIKRSGIGLVVIINF